MNTGDDGPGARLAAARVARGMSPTQVAEQMRLTAAAVLAMEEGRYQDLGPPVFVRGHLRRYASLLGVPVDELLSAYDTAAPQATATDLLPPASLHTPMRSSHLSVQPWQLWIAAFAVIAAVAAGGWWVWHARGKLESAQVAPTPADSVESQAGPAVDQPPADRDAVPPAAPGPQDPPVEALPQPGPVVPTTGGLSLRFTGPCWLEVYDAAGARLAFELAQAGAVRTFSGPPPWRVVLGDARSVRVSVDGRTVTIPSRLVVKDAALVSISGRGEVAPAQAAAVQDS